MDDIIEGMIALLKRFLLLALGVILALAFVSMRLQQWRQAWEEAGYAPGPEVLRH